MEGAGAQEEKQKCTQKCCNLGYFMTALGFSKCLELLVVTLGPIFMATVSAINADSIKFFIFLTTTSELLNVYSLLHVPSIF